MSRPLSEESGEFRLSEPAPDFATALDALARAEVDFIVVGMLAGNLQGVPLSTLDVDIVHRRTPENVSRLHAALLAIDARYLMRRDLMPQPSHLSGPGHNLLLTKLGRLDVLGAIGDNEDYDALLPHTVEVAIGPGLTIRVLDLPTLIRMKEKAAREKDVAALPHLRRTLIERRKRGLEK